VLGKQIDLDEMYPSSAMLRVKFQLRGDNVFNGMEYVDTYGYAKIYKNGSPVGTERSVLGAGYQTFSEDFAFAVGDDIQLYVRTQGSGFGDQAYVAYFRVCASMTSILVNAFGQLIT
jgi:hypothetical protein